MGSYGGGKTLGAFQLAYELYKTGRYRYILGNCNSVWTDNPEQVVLRDDSFVDAIVILDEAGLFLKMSRDADKFLLGLRKLNITILCPSVLPPSSRIKFLQVQRVLNGQSFGLPLWVYQYRLNIGSEREKDNFILWQPQKMFGIYDTLDYPVDDLYLSEWFEYWMAQARESRPEWATWGSPPGYESKGYSRVKGSDSGMDEFRRELEEAQEKNEELSESLSLYAFEATKKRGKHRR
jgi:hypothetical protein